MAPAQAPQLNRQAIGDKLETLRSELIRCGGELRSMQGLLQGSSFVDDALRLLDRLACRIGVIGQVKAGKSSLINALMGKPGDDRFLTDNGNTPIAHGLWRVTAL